MVNPWVEHIKKYAKDHNLSYGCALSTPECKNTYSKASTKSKKKPECKTDCKTCKTCKINKEPHKMYDKPIGPIKPKEINKMYKMYKEPIGPKKQYTQEELLIKAKNIVSYMTGSDQYLSQYDKGWNKKSKEDLLKIVSNFKKKYPEFTVPLSPITMSTLQLLG